MKRWLCRLFGHKWIKTYDWTPAHRYYQNVYVCMRCGEWDWSRIL